MAKTLEQKMRFLSFVIPFYQNQGMLALQYKVWSNYSEELKERIEIVIVDDGSPTEPAINVRRPEGLPPLRIYRVLIDKPWNQHGARNLGAKIAKGPWLFLTDMDHVITSTNLQNLLQHKNRETIYTFARLDAPYMTPTVRPNGSLKPHPNTFAMTKEMYWRIGGYDERFCGIYGTDGLFRSRAAQAGQIKHLENISIIRYPREVIPDASTRTLARKEGRGDSKRCLMDKIKAEGNQDKIEVLTFPWERAF